MKKTELEMEVSKVAKINDSRRHLDFRRDGWELENIIRRDAAMFCACELRPRVILTRCTKRTQVESTWDLCQVQGAPGLVFVCEFVGNIADIQGRRTSTTAQGVVTRSSVKVCRAINISQLER